jgi:hypothetical protein
VERQGSIKKYWGKSPKCWKNLDDFIYKNVANQRLIHFKEVIAILQMSTSFLTRLAAETHLAILYKWQ